jgi:hypothetical protein
MNSDRVIADATKAAQRLLWHTYDLPDAMKVVQLRNFVRSPTVQSVLQHSSDTFLAFTLRAIALVLADQSRTDREMIRRLWEIFNNPHLIQALGPQNSPFGPSWLSVGQHRCDTKLGAPKNHVGTIRAHFPTLGIAEESTVKRTRGKRPQLRAR